MATLQAVLDAANPINLPDALKQVGLGTLLVNLTTVTTNTISVVTETLSTVTNDRCVLAHKPLGLPQLVQVATAPKAPMVGTVVADSYTYDAATKTVQLYASEGGATSYIRYATLETPVASATMAIGTTIALAPALGDTIAALTEAFPALPTR